VTTGSLTNAVGGIIRAIADDTSSSRLLIANLENRGTLLVEADLVFNGNVANSGTVSIPEGRTLTANNVITWVHRQGAITGTGTLSLASGSTLALEGDFTPGGFLLNAPNLTINGPARLLGPATGEFLIRDWTINAPIVVSGDMRITGSVSVSSALSVAQGKTLRLATDQTGSQAFLTVANGFENQGTIELRTGLDGSQVRLTVTTGSLTNAVGGIIRAIADDTSSSRVLFANLENRGTLFVEADLVLNGDVANSGTVSIPEGRTLTANNVITWVHRQGAITGTGTLSLASGSTLALEDDFTPGGFLLSGPNLTINGPARLLGPATGEFLIRDWTINAPMAVSGDMKIIGSVSISSGLSVAQGKTLRVATDQTGSQAFLTVANGFENQGTIELRTGLDGSQVRLTVTTGSLTNAVGGIIRAIADDTSSSRLLIANLENRGTLHVLNGATLMMNGVLINGSSGVLGGNGVFNFAGATLTNEGTVSPGVSPGVLTIEGNLPWASTARFDVEIGGFTAGSQHDQLILSNPADLGGTIRAGLINGFFPKKDDAFTVLTYPSRTGAFASLDNPLPERIAWEVRYGTTSAQLVVLNTAPTLGAIVNRTVDEETLLSITASATDQDLPAQTLTYSLATAPAGMAINPTTGQISWTPTEAQGPGTYNVTVRVTDNGTPALGHTTSFIVTVDEVNVAPQLATPASQNVNEQSEMVLTINATDADIPANALTYEMLSAPPGATFNPATREFRWTPTEVQGPGNYEVTVRVTDNGAPALSHSGSFIITVNEVNVAPQLVLPATPSVNEQNELVLTINGTDADLPANALTYEMLSGPPGATFNPATREFRWTPTEAQGPGSFTATFRSTDQNPAAVNEKQLSATAALNISVNEVNLPPTLLPPTNRTIHAGTVFSAIATATDPDLPANSLTYAKAFGPEGVNVSAAGLVTWATSDADAGTINLIGIVVSDDGTPRLTSTNTFSITVNAPPRFTSFVKTDEILTAAWSSIPGTSYRLQYINALVNDGWLDLSGDVIAEGNSASTVDSSPEPARFYRVRVLP
jgi:hypothetical protein